ncbi:hypothetical protein GE061_003779 [Apolygus lucorum]|uniref:Tubulin--tyrosine ligase-like protein 9 n=1 Tax=Apolygus lucorum TaxID=248454 RepID=A0A8S9X4W4_APOLU|nr:hypothetical protein GE061_003779 [Apolygus lucorum]
MWPQTNRQWSIQQTAANDQITCNEKDNKQALPRRKKIRFRVDSPKTIIPEVLQSRGWIQVDGKSDVWDLFWCDLAKLGMVLEKRLQESQRVPHFRNHYEISRKNYLFRNMIRYKKQLIRDKNIEETKYCDCIPLTFEIPNEYAMFCDYIKNNPKKTYIVKPACGCKGRGIFLFRKLRELNEWKSTKDWTRTTAMVELVDKHGEVIRVEEKDLPPEQYVVQVYVDNPYLIAGRKFDLRFYVLVMSYMPLKVWIARDGFARICGALYNLNNIKDNLSHLTNTSLQLATDVDAKGFKWPLRRLRMFLTAKHGMRAVEELFQKMANLVITSLKSVQKVIMHNKHCFELYGYDVLLTDNLEPWLLEVNASPSLEATDSEDYELKYNLLSDMFTVLDLENQLTGTELRVGGFDLLWDDGPVNMPPPSPDSCGPIIKNPKLNINLGCLNNREEQLTTLKEWRSFMMKDPVLMKRVPSKK